MELDQIAQIPWPEPPQRILSFGLMFNPASTLPSQGIIFSKLKLIWWLRRPLPKPNWWNRFGRKYGVYQCRVRSETSFGGLAKIPSQFWITWNAVAWWKIQSAFSVPNTMRMLSMLYGLARPLHRYGMKTPNGALETKKSSMILPIWSSTFLS